MFFWRKLVAKCYKRIAIFSPFRVFTFSSFSLFQLFKFFFPLSAHIHCDDFAFGFHHELVHVPSNYQHKNGTQYGGHCNGKKFFLDDIEVEHDGYSRRNEEETKVCKQKLGELFYPLQLNDLGFKKEREQQHSDDARW